MNHPRLVRGLRITASAVFGVLSLVLIALWIRSYWRLDRVRVGLPGKSVASLEGRLLFNDVFNINPSRPQLIGSLARLQFAGNYIEVWSVPRGALIPVGVGTTFPVWLLAVVLATLSAVPWVRPRFSLRGLLIATTLIAVVMGIIVLSW